jgi:hypothetical protein
VLVSALDEQCGDDASLKEHQSQHAEDGPSITRPESRLAARSEGSRRRSSLGSQVLDLPAVAAVPQAGRPAHQFGGSSSTGQDGGNAAVVGREGDSRSRPGSVRIGWLAHLGRQQGDQTRHEDGNAPQEDVRAGVHGGKRARMPGGVPAWRSGPILNTTRGEEASTPARRFRAGGLSAPGTESVSQRDE